MRKIKIKTLSSITEDVTIRKALFERMCKQGCRNFGKKWSCPPNIPLFKKQRLLVVIMQSETSQIKDTKEYTKVLLLNQVLKSRIEKLMRALEKHTKTKFYSTGSCRLCRPCKKKLGEQCAKPEQARISLEAFGVDCNHLTKKLFKKELQWYKNGRAPEHTSVVCALPTKLIKEQELEKMLKHEVRILFGINLPDPFCFSFSTICGNRKSNNKQG